MASTENSSPHSSEHQKPNDAQRCAVPVSLRPSARDIMLEQPVPKRLLTALNASSTGAMSVTAAFWIGSFSRPTNHVSARLYSSVTRMDATVGTASVSTAFGTGIVSNRAVLSVWLVRFMAKGSFLVIMRRENGPTWGRAWDGIIQRKSAKSAAN